MRMDYINIPICSLVYARKLNHVSLTANKELTQIAKSFTFSISEGQALRPLHDKTFVKTIPTSCKRLKPVYHAVKNIALKSVCHALILGISPPDTKCL